MKGTGHQVDNGVVVSHLKVKLLGNKSELSKSIS